MEQAADIGQGPTKWDIRQKVWDNFPGTNHKIPNFKSCGVLCVLSRQAAAQACNRLPVLQEFKSSRVVKVNPDRPQEQARFHTLAGSSGACHKIVTLEVFNKTRKVKVDPDKTLEAARLAVLKARKTLLVPTPRLRTGLFNKIVPPQNATKEALQVCSTSQGLKEFSVPISLGSRVQVDLIVVGSVAVSEKGYRIGKGEGYADMEYAIMASIGAVKESTVVVTVVHDCQVVDIPERLTESHDLTVDYIITPSRIIKTGCQLPKPQGIIWSKLNAEMLEKIPILKQLRALEQKAGKDVPLKVSSAESDEPTAEPKRDPESRPRCEPEQEPKHQHIENGAERPEGGAVEQEDPHGSSNTLYFGNIPAEIRVSELKSVLRERKVVPSRLEWQWVQHRAYLEYSDGPEADFALTALQDLSINGHTLKAERAKSLWCSRRRNKALQRPKK